MVVAMVVAISRHLMFSDQCIYRITLDLAGKQVLVPPFYGYTFYNSHSQVVRLTVTQDDPNRSQTRIG
jgi:hypothetical protein